MGRHEAKVRLAPTTDKGEAVPPIAIPVAFDVLHDIQPETPFVVLGIGRVGETLRSSFAVSSLSNRSFARPTCDAGVVTVRARGGPSNSQTSHPFDFEHTVTATGNHTQPVVGRGTDADGHPLEFRVEVPWYGVPN